MYIYVNIKRYLFVLKSVTNSFSLLYIKVACVYVVSYRSR